MTKFDEDVVAKCLMYYIPRRLEHITKMDSSNNTFIPIRENFAAPKSVLIDSSSMSKRKRDEDASQSLGDLSHDGHSYDQTITNQQNTSLNDLPHTQTMGIAFNTNRRSTSFNTSRGISSFSSVTSISNLSGGNSLLSTTVFDYTPLPPPSIATWTNDINNPSIVATQINQGINMSGRTIKVDDPLDIVERVTNGHTVVCAGYEYKTSSTYSSTNSQYPNFEMTRAKSEINSEVNHKMKPTHKQFWYSTDVPFQFAIIGRYPTWVYRYNPILKKYERVNKSRLWLKIVKTPITIDPINFFITTMTPRKIEEVPEFCLCTSRSFDILDNVLRHYHADYNNRVYDLSQPMEREVYFNMTMSLVRSLKETMERHTNFRMYELKRKCTKVRKFRNLEILCFESKVQSISQVGMDMELLKEIVTFLPEDYTNGVAHTASSYFSSYSPI